MRLISFEARVALVVGGTSGMGWATAERLGATVVVAGRREELGARVASEPVSYRQPGSPVTPG
jgi:NAD(P)-dependent dehydrogenase (short-subunit alcohol dehydrogenase family)